MRKLLSSMKKNMRRELIFVFSWLVSLTVIAQVEGNNPSTPSHQQKQTINLFDQSAGTSWEGTIAPDFTLKDLSDQDFKLSSLRGKYVLLDFWGTWCHACVQGTPRLISLYEKYHVNNNFEMVSIAYNDPVDRWKKGVKEHQMTWVQVRESRFKGDLCDKYDIMAFPTFIFISPEGKILKRWIGNDQRCFADMESLIQNHKQ